jgi:hypothetical protein
MQRTRWQSGDSQSCPNSPFGLVRQGQTVHREKHLKDGSRLTGTSAAANAQLAVVPLDDFA